MDEPKYVCKKCKTPYMSLREIKTFKCKDCGFFNILKNTNPYKAPTTTEQAPADTGILDGLNLDGDNSGKDLNIKVESNNKDFQKIPDSEIKTDDKTKGKIIEKTTVTVKDGNTVTKQTLTPTVNAPFQGETFAKFFSMSDEVMKSKSSATVWDVSKKEEDKLGDLWADVANAYAPQATSKEVKLVVATASTLAVYVPRTVQYIKAYNEGKRRNKGTDVKKEIAEGLKDEKEMTEQEKQEALNPPTTDKDFADKWKAKGAN